MSARERKRLEHEAEQALTNQKLDEILNLTREVNRKIDRLDDRVDDIACDLVERFMKKVATHKTYRNATPTQSVANAMKDGAPTKALEGFARSFGADIGSLKVQAPVRTAGVLVGRVSRIELDPQNFQAKVSLEIDSQYRYSSDDYPFGYWLAQKYRL